MYIKEKKSIDNKCFFFANNTDIWLIMTVCDFSEGVYYSAVWLLDVSWQESAVCAVGQHFCVEMQGTK